MGTPISEAARDNQIVLSNSLLSKVQSCEREFHYEYVRGWGYAPKRAMNFGSWFHALAAVNNLRKGITEGTLLVVPETLHLGFEGLEEVEVDAEGLGLTFEGTDYPLDWEGAMALLYRQQWSMLPKETRESFTGSDKVYVERGMDFPDQVADLFRRWSFHWDEAHKGEKVLLVEAQWQRTHGSTGLVFGGRIDVVVQRADNFITARDYKTTGSQPSMAYRLTNYQTLLYAWGVQALLDDLGFDGRVRMVELDYLITTPPGLLRLKKDGDPYANVGKLDTVSFLDQCHHLGEDPMDPKFAKIREKIDAYTNDDHAFFQRWEMVASPTSIAQVVEENIASWDRARDLLMGRPPVRNLHPVLCGMCSFQTECALEFKGGTPEGRPSSRTLPLIGGGEVSA